MAWLVRPGAAWKGLVVEGVDGLMPPCASLSSHTAIALTCTPCSSLAIPSLAMPFPLPPKHEAHLLRQHEPQLVADVRGVAGCNALCAWLLARDAPHLACAAQGACV